MAPNFWNDPKTGMPHQVWPEPAFSGPAAKMPLEALAE
jgi:hypothetical protein